MAKVKDVLESMPASVNSYLAWLLDDKLGLSDEEMKDYNFLFNDLIKLPFRFSHPMDENRYEDGLNLRKDFSYETEKFLDSSSGIIPGCSFLEMLVALAYKCEHQLMRNVDIGDRTKKWFFIMLKNLDFDRMTNKNWQYEYSEEVKNRVKSIGSGENLFIFKGKKHKNEEIWKQLMAYLNENEVGKESDGLELYDRRE